MAAASRPARRMSAASAAACGGSAVISASSSCAHPLMTVRMLLKSCATPPAIRPTASNWPATCNCPPSLAFSSDCRRASAAARRTCTRSAVTVAPPSRNRPQNPAVR